jgi:hypothetical protein
MAGQAIEFLVKTESDGERRDSFLSLPWIQLDVMLEKDND